MIRNVFALAGALFVFVATLPPPLPPVNQPPRITMICPFPDGDFDRDYDVDLIDFQAFQSCFGRTPSLAIGCMQCQFIVDRNLDGRLTIRDYGWPLTDLGNRGGLPRRDLNGCE